VDSETASWNVDPALLSEAVEDRARSGNPPAAVVVVDLYGQTADLESIRAVCSRHGIPLVEDAAEALGATYRGQAAGTLGTAGFFSFNGNKIITTSGGGALVSEDGDFIAHARKLATQARDPASHYQHSEIGYNYRLSNVLAGIGRGQLRLLDDRVARRRATFAHYAAALGDLPGVAFQPEAPWGTSNRWLTCLTIDPGVAGTDRERVCLALEAEAIEARPVWKPMHLQPVFGDCLVYGGAVSERLFEHGLCLPSGSDLSARDLDRITSVIRREFA
jgi:pyridoxal phosphate-dependent aminotransferase EpsN